MGTSPFLCVRAEHERATIRLRRRPGSELLTSRFPLASHDLRRPDKVRWSGGSRFSQALCGADTQRARRKPVTQPGGALSVKPVFARCADERTAFCARPLFNNPVLERVKA